MSDFDQRMASIATYVSDLTPASAIAHILHLAQTYDLVEQETAMRLSPALLPIVFDLADRVQEALDWVPLADGECLCDLIGMAVATAVDEDVEQPLW